MLTFRLLQPIYKKLCVIELGVFSNLRKLIRLFYKNPGSTYLKVKRRFPSINIAFGFKIS